MHKIVSLVSAMVAVAFIVIIMGGVASATGSSTLNVSATVVGTCNFNTTSSNMSFSLDPNSGADVNVTVTPTFWCTRGTTVTTVTTNNGLYASGTTKRMRSAANTGEFIPYSVVLTPASTVGGGKASPINLTVTGTVLYTDYQNSLAANDYTDTVTITILP